MPTSEKRIRMLYLLSNGASNKLLSPPKQVFQTSRDVNDSCRHSVRIVIVFSYNISPAVSYIICSRSMHPVLKLANRRNSSRSKKIQIKKTF